MKLSQLYSDGPFKDVRFNTDFNVIIGHVEDPHNPNVDTHNLGKTTLLEIIDFMFLKGVNRTHFLLKHGEIFHDYTFWLELELADNAYVTIRRSVSTPTKIKFKQHKTSSKLTELVEWDSELSLQKAVEFLNNLLGFDVAAHWDYRASVTYFLRNQYDYRDVFQLDKYGKGKDKAWKPLLFALLGFDSAHVNRKYQLDDERIDLKKRIASSEAENKIQPADEDKVRGLLSIRKAQREELVETLNNLNFYEREREMNSELIEEVESSISEQNSLDYRLSYEIENIRKALDLRSEFDLDTITRVFGEAEIAFPDGLRKSYESLVEFNRVVTSERNKHLRQQLQKLQEDRSETHLRLKGLNERRAELLAILSGGDLLSKFKGHQSQLVKVENEILRFEISLEALDTSKRLREELRSLENQTAEEIEAIRMQISKSNQTYLQIRTVFNDAIKHILSHNGLLSLSLNGEGNLEFAADIEDEVTSSLTSEGHGATYRKMLCVAFDLALLVTYSRNSFFKFVYHDGVMDGMDHRKKKSFLGYARSTCERYGIQYILSTLEHELPIDDNGVALEFPKRDIILELSDSGDEGRLFLQRF